MEQMILSPRQRERGQRVRGTLEKIKELWKENGNVRIKEIIGWLGMKGVRKVRAVEYLDTLKDAGKIRRTGNKIIYNGSNGQTNKVEEVCGGNRKGNISSDPQGDEWREYLLSQSDC